MAVFGARSSGLEKPRLERLNLRLQPFQLFKTLKSHYQDAFLLESLTGAGRLAEYSFMGFNPALIIEVYEGYARVYEGSSITEYEADPAAFLRGIVPQLENSPHMPRYVGGLVGYVSYEAAYLWEEILRAEKPDDGFPLMKFGFFKDALIYDHHEDALYYSHAGEGRLPELLRLLREADPISEPGKFSHSPPRSNMSKKEFIEIVEAGKEHIERGDVFQVVLSRMLELEIAGDLLSFYLRLRSLNPSPYMYYLKLGQDEVIGASPEMLVRVEGDRVTTFPIAGTRPRARDPVLDELSDRELLADEKERAEHVMLVDLARNDLGKVAEPGTVEVKELMTVIRYSHVKHLVSRVEARLRSRLDMYDAFKAVFPAGTVSGAPKPRAMELIEELEPVRRGPYAGAVGYFSLNGSCDFAITIRSLIRRGDHASIQAGAGIVWDSVPEREWMETQHKMMALVRALEGGLD